MAQRQVTGEMEGKNNSETKASDPESNLWPYSSLQSRAASKNYSTHSCALELHLILVCSKWQKTEKALDLSTTGPRRCPVTLPAVVQSHQQVSCLPKYAGRVCAEPRAPVTMRPLCSSGCQPVCPRVLFPSNLHLTFRLTAFLSPFSRLISFEEIIFEPHQRLTDSDDMTHTTRRSRFWREASLAATVAAVCWEQCEPDCV